MDQFEFAARKKLRFDSPVGELSVEDIWDLPLTSSAGKPNLDAIAVKLHAQLQTAGGTVSFVNESSNASATELLQKKFDIVKHVIDDKKAENKARLEAKERAETKKRITEILANRQDKALEGKSDEELLRMVAEL